MSARWNRGGTASGHAAHGLPSDMQAAALRQAAEAGDLRKVKRVHSHFAGSIDAPTNVRHACRTPNVENPTLLSVWFRLPAPAACVGGWGFKSVNTVPRGTSDARAVTHWQLALLLVPR